MQNNQTYDADELNPAYIFNLTWTELLLKLADGTLNAQELARKEMANRGLGRNGEWVGFVQAKEEWKLTN